MEEREFLLDIVYKNKTVKFKVVNPEAPIETLMTNLRHAIGNDGKLIFDFPSIDQTEIRVLRPRIGHTDQTLGDYKVNNGDTLYLVADPFPG